MANAVSGFRVICGLLLLCFPAFSGCFFLFYILGGVSDAVDGAIARRLNQVTDFGSKLDTIADIVFVVASLIKVLSAVSVPVWLEVWIAVIALIKVINVASGFVVLKRFIAAHTLMNKVCGVMIFFIPFCIKSAPWQMAVLFVIATCTAATLAAIQEGHHIFRLQICSHQRLKHKKGCGFVSAMADNTKTSRPPRRTM